MNMFLHELKAYRKSTIIWICTLSAVIIMFLAMYPGISNSAVDFKKLLEGYPEGVRKAMGISLDTITSFLGFYSYIFVYITLAGAIQAMNFGVSILSKEVREETADFLLTKPVTRKQIVTAKLLAVFTSIGITNIIFLIVASIMASIINSDDFSMKIFIMLSITLFFVQLLFLSLGVIISVIVPKIKSVLPISLATVFSFFILNMFGSVIGEKAIRYLTPFKYFDLAYISKNSAYESSFIIIEILFIIVTITASYIIYSKRDIHAV